MWEVQTEMDAPRKRCRTQGDATLQLQGWVRDVSHAQTMEWRLRPGETLQLSVKIEAAEPRAEQRSDTARDGVASRKPPRWDEEHQTTTSRGMSEDEKGREEGQGNKGQKSEAGDQGCGRKGCDGPERLPEDAQGQAQKVTNERIGWICMSMHGVVPGRHPEPV